MNNYPPADSDLATTSSPLPDPASAALSAVEAAAPVSDVPAAVAAPAPAKAKPDEYQWDGVERSMVTAINGVDINAASASELHRLPGVGASRAKDIIAYREQHGQFSNIYGLANVPGIGEKLFRQITGLPLNVRRNRYVLLNGMLGLPPETEIGRAHV